MKFLIWPDAIRVAGDYSERWLFVDLAIGLAQGRAVVIGSSGPAGPEGLDLPRAEIDEVTFFPFAAAKVEEDLYLVAGLEAGNLGDLVFDGLKFDVLRITIGLGGDDKFTLGEAAAEGLFVEKFFNGACDIEHSRQIYADDSRRGQRAIGKSE